MAWRERGGEFLTEPNDRGDEIRCSVKDPDAHLRRGRPIDRASLNGKAASAIPGLISPVIRVNVGLGPSPVPRASSAARTFGGDIGSSVSRVATARLIALAIAAIGGQMLTSAARAILA